MFNKRLHAYFSGRVQGVGFRFTAQRIACTLNLGGWVRNLSDGRVEVVLEGQEKAINNFLQQLNVYFRDYLRDIDVEWQEKIEGLNDFQIRF